MVFNFHVGRKRLLVSVFRVWSECEKCERWSTSISINHTHYLFTEKWANFPFISIHSVNHLHIYTNFVSISYGVRSSAYNIWLHIILSKSLRTVYFLKSKWNSLRCKCIYLHTRWLQIIIKSFNAQKVTMIFCFIFPSSCGSLFI